MPNLDANDKGLQFLRSYLADGNKHFKSDVAKALINSDTVFRNKVLRDKIFAAALDCSSGILGVEKTKSAVKLWLHQEPSSRAQHVQNTRVPHANDVVAALQQTAGDQTLSSSQHATKNNRKSNKKKQPLQSPQNRPDILLGHLVVLVDHASSLISDNVRDCLAQMHRDLEEFPVIGYDVEWKPVFMKGVKPRLALLQMASRHVCLLVKLHPDCRDADAPVLEALFGPSGLFSRPSLIVCGAGVSSDVKQLKQQLGIDIFSRVCDIGELTVEWGISRKKSLDAAFLAAVGKPMHKSRRVAMSNWEKEPLSAVQVQYASDDAVAGVAILASVFYNHQLLASYKEWPTPPPPVTISGPDLHAIRATSDELWHFVTIMKESMQALKTGSMEVFLKALQIAGGHLIAQNGGIVVAAKYGHLECLRAILARIDNVKTYTQDGLAVQAAIQHNQFYCLQVLAESGVDVNARVKNVSSISALQLAVKMGHTECVRVLLDAGVNVNEVSYGGVTALSLCKFGLFSGVTRMLFTAGANMNLCETAHRDAILQDELRARTTMKPIL